MTKKYFFSHDYKARSDSKMMDCQMQFGMAGIGLYWCLIEMLYESDGYIEFSQCNRIAFELRIEESRIAELIQKTELFESDSQKFWSNSVLERLEFIEKRSKTGKKNAGKRWKKNDNQLINATASDLQCEKNAIASDLQWEEDKTRLDKTRLDNIINSSSSLKEEEEFITQTVSPSEVDSSRYQLNRATENPPHNNKQLFKLSFQSEGINLDAIGTETLYTSLVNTNHLDKDPIWEASEGKFDRSTLASYLQNKFPKNYTNVQPYKTAVNILKS